MKILIGCATDQGNYQDKNQDCVICHKARNGKTDLAIACVCDGIGSFENSEIAAIMMTEGISKWFQGIITYHPKTISDEELLEDLELTIKELNELIYRYRQENRVDIGCTMSLILIINKEYYIFNVGDSRIYCFRDELAQITHDEVIIRAVNGKVRSLLANYIGKSNELWMNRLNGTINENDVLIVGSDGLYKQLRAEDLIQVKKARNDKAINIICRSLLSIMMDRGEKDNLSCAVLLFHKGKSFL